MKRFQVVIALLSGLMAINVFAQNAQPVALSENDLAEIRSVVNQQLSAINTDDAEMAFAFASPGVQEAFGTSDRFLYMVRRGYSSLYKPRHVEFLELTVVEGEMVQPVRLVAQDGSVEVALYEMQRQADLQWRINGCDIAKSELTSL
jgi:hypothetical protein